MLVTSVLSGPKLVPSAQQYLDSAQRWLALSRTRTACDDAYGDLLLATLDFGAARTQVLFVKNAQQRAALGAFVDRVMTALLTRSHELRVACRAPLSR
jgi:hypothetical protein